MTFGVISKGSNCGVLAATVYVVK